MRSLIHGVFRVSLGLAAIGSSLPAQNADSTRVPWTTSRLHGSPEPPPPYEARRVFSELRFKDPTELAFIPNSDNALVLSRAGQIDAFDTQTNTPESVLLADLNTFLGRGTEVYSITFHPGFATNHHVFISHTGRGTSERVMQVSRFELYDGQPPRLETAGRKLIIEWPSGGHNGCSLQFGHDGYLYISAGDGDSPAPPDPRRTGQSLDDLLSSIMRLDVDHTENGRPYRVPADNPFLHREGARPEIWAYGFRNPWKISVDPRDGAVWVGDVGWENWELLYRVDHAGFNGGWSIVEGPQRINTTWEPGPTPIQPPVKAHPHTEAVSITGGLVYRGTRLPDLKDSYVYGDWGTGRMWALRWGNDVVESLEEIAITPHRIICFAEDRHHELFYMDYNGGGIYELASVPSKTQEGTFPRLLSETGIFTSVAHHDYAPGVYPYEIAARMWADHAEAEFAVALPGNSQLAFSREGFSVPTNAVVVRTASMELKKGDPTTRRRIETQLLHFDGVNFNGYSYRWNEDQTDAALVEAHGDSRRLLIEDRDAPEGRREQTWRFHARAECSRCHLNQFDSRFGSLNGLIPQQLAGKRRSADVTELDRFRRLDLIDPATRYRSQWTLADPYDDSVAVDTRARSWLHVNCAHCHREAGTGAVVMYLEGSRSLQDTRTVNTASERGAFNIDSNRRIHAGHPYNSTLLYRIMTPGSGRMPMIGSAIPDDTGIRLIRDWIAGLSFPSSNASAVGSASPADLRSALETTSGAMELSCTLVSGALPRSKQEEIVAVAMNSTNPPTRDLFERFLPWDQRRQQLGLDIDPSIVLAHVGDVERGRALFFSPVGSQCYTCHRVAGQGRDVGPDLSRIGSKYDRPGLLEQILDPNRLVEPAWVGHTVETGDGEMFSGLIVSRSAEELSLKIADGTVVRFGTGRIRSERPMTLSMMPEGLLHAMTVREAADLLAFLQACR